MSYELFVGLAETRLIRKAEFSSYHKAETTRPSSARAKTASELPAPVQKILSDLQSKWPDTRVTKEGKTAGYVLSKSSFLASFSPDDALTAHIAVRDLTMDNGALYYDAASGGWLNAAQPAGATVGPGFTCERCVLRFVTTEDLRLLLGPDWFKDGRFFCIAPGQDHWVQVLDHGSQFYIEYRAGPGRPVFRSVKSEIGPVAALLQGYLAGQNMNTPEYEFKALSVPPDPDAGLPVRRDSQGRWVPA